MLKMHAGSERGSMVSWGLPAAVALLGGVSLYSLINLHEERNRSQQLASVNQDLRSSLQQVQGEMQSVSQKLNAMLVAQSQLQATPQTKPAQEVTEGRQNPRRSNTRHRVAAVHVPPRKPADDTRIKKIEASLADQRKQIANARQQANQNRQDLEGQLNSQHDELSGSIAKNHDELVSLQKRGERNYYEFDLDKSKQFQRVGPLSLSLRSVNLKHKYYDVEMTVDDQRLEKKHVNLYEPLVFTVADRPQPIELVVNDIEHNEIKGYVSEAKYKNSDLASTSTAPAPADDSKRLERR